jgi:hypothetical protein
MLRANQWGRARFSVQNADATPFQITATGRERWALECLIAVGASGCTPIDNPGPRWPAYVFDLKAMGLVIETLTEAHGGPFAGHHARYVLRSSVSLFEELQQ